LETGIPGGAGRVEALSGADIERSIKRIAHEIIERNDNPSSLVLIGILRRGGSLAQRRAGFLQAETGVSIPVGVLDISSYRDDGRSGAGHPEVLGRDIPVALDCRRVVLVDDVLYTGRTVRAALDAIADLGRPDGVQLAVLGDRGEHELPIRADYVGRNLSAPPGQRIYVRLQEVDGIDSVVIGGGK
jgi:pyrimidine operon attenuation protein/uracil phosphoribosyltransferase